MSGKLRELKTRIKSVENTKKITRAMEMVAAAKLRRFQNLMIQARPYTEGLQSLLRRLNQNLPAQEGALEDDKKGRGSPRPSRGRPAKSHPFFEQRDEKKIAVVLITSDSGLCGSYNLMLIDRAFQFLNEHPAEKVLVGVGKSGIHSLKRAGYDFADTFIEIRPARFDEILEKLKTRLEQLYLSNEVSSVYVIYNQFLTSSTYRDVTEKLLPLEKPVSEAAEGKKQDETEYLFEPSTDLIFERLIPVFFTAKTRQIFLEAVVSEQLARMTAMHSATENAKEMIDALVLQRNKARQASITKEIIEIVSGSQALKRK